jgi:ChaB
MYQIPEMLYNEKMPARAKRLFTQTFSKYHKLNGGDEDIALHKARNALEEQYVKDPSNSWIPKTAAYEIIKDNIDDDDDDDDDDDNNYEEEKYEKQNSKPSSSKIMKQNTRTNNVDADGDEYYYNDNDMSQSDYTSTDENDSNYKSHNRSKLPRRPNYFRKQQFPTNETSEDEDDDDDDNDYYYKTTNFYK